MTEPQTFRSAFNGFHREDVVNHIAYMTTKHEAQVKELREENDALQTELSQLRGQMDQDAADRDRIPSLEQTIADRDAELASLREELETANQLMNEQAAQMAALREELEEAKKMSSVLSIHTEIPSKPLPPLTPGQCYITSLKTIIWRLPWWYSG